MGKAKGEKKEAAPSSNDKIVNLNEKVMHKTSNLCGSSIKKTRSQAKKAKKVESNLKKVQKLKFLLILF